MQIPVPKSDYPLTKITVTWPNGETAMVCDDTHRTLDCALGDVDPDSCTIIAEFLNARGQHVHGVAPVVIQQGVEAKASESETEEAGEVTCGPPIRLPSDDVPMLHTISREKVHQNLERLKAINDGFAPLAPQPEDVVTHVLVPNVDDETVDEFMAEAEPDKRVFQPGPTPK